MGYSWPKAVPSQMVTMGYTEVPESPRLSLAYWQIQMKYLEKHVPRLANITGLKCGVKMN
jgi:hypothetical protein